MYKNLIFVSFHLLLSLRNCFAETTTIKVMESNGICPESHVICLDKNTFTMCLIIKNGIFVLDDKFSCPANYECDNSSKTPCRRPTTTTPATSSLPPFPNTGTEFSFPTTKSSTSTTVATPTTTTEDPNATPTKPTTTTTIRRPTRPSTTIEVCKDYNTKYPAPKCNQYYTCSWKFPNSWKLVLHDCPTGNAYSLTTADCVSEEKANCVD